MSTTFSPSPAGSSSAKEAGLAAAPPATALLGTQAGPRLVYVIENDRISAVITELIVKKNLLGSEVRCYSNGQQAFEDLALASQTGAAVPDLLVLDLDMPLMDGWEFLDAVTGLALPHPIRAFVLTSSIHPEDQEKALGYKVVQGFFTKPLKDAGVALMQELLRTDWAA